MTIEMKVDLTEPSTEIVEGFAEAMDAIHGATDNADELDVDLAACCF